MHSVPECGCSGPGYCPRYRQLMPEPLWRICAGADGRLDAGQCAGYRASWDRDGGPLGLRKGLQQVARSGEVPATRHTPLGMAVPAQARIAVCKHLGEWTGRLCQH